MERGRKWEREGEMERERARESVYATITSRRLGPGRLGLCPEPFTQKIVGLFSSN